MTDDTPETRLYGDWNAAGYRGDAGIPAAEDLLLELKSAEAGESGADLRDILNEVTREMKAQLVLFQRLRVEAGAALDDPAADQKQARADLKAASDAVSLIIRTLDKTDELQRKLADAREAEDDRNVDPDRLDAICAAIDGHIAARAAGLAASGAGDATTGSSDPGHHASPGGSG